MLRDLLGDQRTQELAEDLGYAIDQLKNLGWKELRPWSEFFAVIKLPQWNVKHLEQRVTTNFLHYRSNYAVICASLFTIRLVFAPFLLLALVCVVAFSAYLLLIHRRPIVVGEITLNDNAKRILCVVVSLVFLALSGALEVLLWTVIYCLLLCISHMVFRPRSVTSKTNKLYEELKLTGFTWFGGQGEGGSANDLAEQDPESAVGSATANPYDELNYHAGMTSASVRKRPAGTATTQAGKL